ncbi:MAG: hydroxyacid dehydrogenase [Pseudomonadota bacterium]|nr:hydroxyacid dehydrogenase [Pseudomonadota bacterium]MED6310254.1 hydroxyacid dehydrogenase [Pseudomonadota bacterium]
MSDSHKKTILIDGDVHPTALSVLEARDDVELAKVPLEDAAALAEAATGANGILARSARITPELIASANGLQVVSRHGVGYDRVNVEALSARKIPLTVTGTANSPSVAEHAMMFMLACAKRLRPTDQRTREGDFLKARQELGRVELLEKKVLIIGFGRIGKIVARRCQGFDMEVLACDPYIDQQAIRDAGVTPVENFRDVLSDIDYLTIHVPLSDETENLISAKELAQLKSTAIVVNCARGGIINEDALYEVLKNEKIFGAGVDVFAIEPTPGDHPLFTLDNVLVNPHAAASAMECLERMGVQAAQNILDQFDGKLDPEMVVNQDVL